MAYIQDVRAKTGHMPLVLATVAGALVNDRQQVLLQERVDTGNWSFPGGYMGFGESFDQTLKRELLEDSGMVVEPVKLLATLDGAADCFDYPNGDRVQPVTIFYLVKAVCGHPITERTKETVRTKWFAVDHTPKMFNSQNEKMARIVAAYVEQQQSKPTK